MSDDARNLLGWFGKRKENVVQNGIMAHAISVLDCVTELGMANRCMVNGDTSGAVMCIDRLFVNEREADSLEDDLSAQLSIGELSAQEREDLLHFVRKTDSIANWSKEAALHIQLIIETGAQVPIGIWEGLVGISADLESEVKYLMNAIKLLGTDTQEIRECIEGVKDQERLIDRSTFNMIKAIHLSDMDYKPIMLTCKVVDAMEMAADAVKGCADTITILMVARRV